jgi:DNA-binding response OmpR family regulator
VAIIILIVDDEPTIAALVAESLHDAGYCVAVVHDRASAVRIGLPDLVLLDINMPVMPGDEVLRELRSNSFASLPIIVMSAAAHPERFLARGATATLTKPINIDLLLAIVTRCLSE